MSWSNEETNQYWLDQIKQAEQFDGSIKEYCRLNKMLESKFYYHKQRLGIKSARKKSFAKISISEKLSGVESKKIDPEWLAKFIKHLVP